MILSMIWLPICVPLPRSGNAGCAVGSGKQCCRKGKWRNSMKILILHRIPYHKIQYERGIDHSLHDVVYVGTAAALDNIPKELRCTKIVRPGAQSASQEILKMAGNGLINTPDLVISLSEYELLEAARVREALGVPGPSFDQVCLVRDKILMKEAVARAGIR